MEKGQGTRPEAEWDRLMDEIVDLVKFTKDKDIFREFYISQLAKRLLSGRSASNEDEIKMVKKLQNGQWFLMPETCASGLMVVRPFQSLEKNLQRETP